MRRILFILKGLPYPIDRDGLSVINYRLLKMASEDYWFDIISLSEESKETILGTRGISNRIARIMVLPDKISDSSSGRIFRLVARLFGKGTLPYDKLLREQERNYDLIYICTPPSAFYLPMFNCTTPMFVNAVDSFSMLNFRFYKQHRTIARFIKYVMYRIVERRCFAYSDVINFVSSVDADYSKNLLDRKKIIVIPNGVDYAYFNSGNAVEREENALLFVGNYKNISNVTGIEYFVNKIYPLIKKRTPHLKLYIVGPYACFDFKDDDVIVTGYVEDLREYYRRCTVFIAPLLTGSGIKNKILEAMAAGIPIVSSSVGVDGIHVENGRHLLIVDGINQWCDEIVELLHSIPKREKLAINAQNYVKSNYAWNGAVSQYFQQFSSLIERK